MTEHVVIEILKLRRSAFLWIFLITGPAIVCLLAYMTARGFEINSNTPLTSFEKWAAILDLNFASIHFLFMLLGGLFLIAWQQREHADNTFKIYYVATDDSILAIQVRFIVFYAIFILALIASDVMSILVIQHVWGVRYADDSIDPATGSYIRHILKAQIILLFPFYLFLFMVTARVRSVSASVVILTGLIIASVISFPHWLFFRSMSGAILILRNIYSGSGLYTLRDLSQVYVYNISWSVILLAVLYYTTHTRKLFI